MKVLDQALGQEGKMEIKFEDGKALVTVSYEGKGGGASMTAFANAEYFLDKLAEASPGQVDDMIILALKAAIK